MNQPYETQGWFCILWINCKRKFKYTHEYETKGTRTVLWEKKKICSGIASKVWRETLKKVYKITASGKWKLQVKVFPHNVKNYIEKQNSYAELVLYMSWWIEHKKLLCEKYEGNYSRIHKCIKCFSAVWWRKFDLMGKTEVSIHLKIT